MKKMAIEYGLKKPTERLGTRVANAHFLFDIVLLLSFKISTGQLLLQQFLKGWLHITANAILKVCQIVIILITLMPSDPTLK